MWCYNFGQPDLFSSVPEHKGIAVLDTNVIFDLQDPETKKNEESKALEADWVRELISLAITDEVFFDIDRAKSSSERNRRKTFASRYVQHPYDEREYTQVIQSLRTALSKCNVRE